jgi:hypothetical protein
MISSSTGKEKPMNQTTIDQAEDEIPNYAVSDESLETAAAAGNSGAYTLGFCTGLSECPAP